jgi:hypothetical protein
MNEFKSYSQYKEDEVLRTLLGDTGYFLEIGAYHPTIFSNTRFLVERNWSGCYLEGSPSAMARFVDEYRDNDKITLINSLFGDKSHVTLFYDSIGDGISSTDINHVEKWKTGAGSKFKKIFSPVIDQTVLYQFIPSTVDFINIDVEGQSAYFSTLIDYNKLNTKVICIEHDNQQQKLREYFSSIGYYPHFENHTNIIFTKSN